VRCCQVSRWAAVGHSGTLVGHIGLYEVFPGWGCCPCLSFAAFCCALASFLHKLPERRMPVSWLSTQSPHPHPSTCPPLAPSAATRLGATLTDRLRINATWALRGMYHAAPEGGAAAGASLQFVGSLQSRLR